MARNRIHACVWSTCLPARLTYNCCAVHKRRQTIQIYTCALRGVLSRAMHEDFDCIVAGLTGLDRLVLVEPKDVDMQGFFPLAPIDEAIGRMTKLTYLQLQVSCSSHSPSEAKSCHTHCIEATSCHTHSMCIAIVYYLYTAAPGRRVLCRTVPAWCKRILLLTRTGDSGGTSGPHLAA